MADGEEAERGFLARWSERKLEARQAPEVAEARVQVPVDPPGAAGPDELSILTDADMPSLESLDEGSDYSGFLSPGVSSGLRRKALSKLFHGARFNVSDGLDDYAEDFTGFLPLGDIITADMRYRMEEAAKRLLATGDGTADPAEGTAEVSGSGEAAEPPPEIVTDAGDEPADGEPA